MLFTSLLATIWLPLCAAATPLNSFAEKPLNSFAEKPDEPDVTVIMRARGYEGTGCDPDNQKGPIVTLEEAGTSACGKCEFDNKCKSIFVTVQKTSEYVCDVYTYGNKNCAGAHGTFVDSLAGEFLCFNSGTKFGSYKAVCTNG